MGRVALVTGGTRGIGAAICKALKKAGYNVAAVYHGNDDAAKAFNKATKIPVFKWDVGDYVAAEQGIVNVENEVGPIEVLVNNASLMSALARRSWLEIPVDEWDRVMAVNLRGMFLCCRAFVPAMRQKGYGKIVNISSSRVWEGTPNRLHYTTSKAGVIGFTRALAREVGPWGITVNAVTPGNTQSDTQVGTSSPDYLKGRIEGRAIGRAQVPEDLVGAVMFLSSPASDFMTGQTVNVDGGRMMH